MTTVPTDAAPDAHGAEQRELLPHEAYVPGHHWRNAEDEAEGAKLGMWLFLSTEVLLFAGFFCAYAIFRYMYPGVWHEASRYYLDWQIGFANTGVLLLSSFTIVLAIRAAQQGNRGMILLNLWITQACAAFFLIVKLAFEYYPKIVQKKLPGAFYDYPAYAAEKAAAAEAAVVSNPAIIPAADAAAKAGEHAHHFEPGSHDHLFLSIYWISTATHGLHVLLGMVVIGWVMWKAAKWHYGPTHYTSLENVGLYWHLVDVIWIFLFPLLYLV